MSAWFTRFGFANVERDLLTGAMPLDSNDVTLLRHEGVEVVHNLCEDSEYPDGQRAALASALHQAGIQERREPLPDYAAIHPDQLERIVASVMADLDAGRRVYVHCRAGWQRSAVVAAAVIALREQLDVEDALEELRERKPTSEPLEHQRAGLHAWWSARAMH